MHTSDEGKKIHYIVFILFPPFDIYFKMKLLVVTVPVIPLIGFVTNKMDIVNIF